MVFELLSEWPVGCNDRIGEVGHEIHYDSICVPGGGLYSSRHDLWRSMDCIHSVQQSGRYSQGRMSPSCLRRLLCRNAERMTVPASADFAAAPGCPVASLLKLC